jgi:hypothetical protein
VDRVIGILKLSGVDPVFVNEAARGFSVIAQGKGKDKGKASHLTGKVGSKIRQQNRRETNVSYCTPRRCGTMSFPNC